MSKTQEQTLTLDFNLAELLSAQHRAGLAGLILMIRELEKQEWFEIRQEEKGALLSIESLDQYGAKIQFNLEGLIALFDLTYGAFLEPRISKNKVSNPIEIEEVTTLDDKGKEKVTKIYHYKTLVPKGGFLANLDISDNKLWIKAWRSMYWDIIRSRDKSRIPFKERCVENWHDVKSYSDDASKLWGELSESQKIKQSSSFYLGAESSNADGIEIFDLAVVKFLLNFWPFVSLVYYPALIDKKGKRGFPGDPDIKKKSSQYVIVVPDVINLEDFCCDFPDLIKERNSSNKRLGFRPLDAVIDVPEEAALNLLFLIKKILSQTSGFIQVSDLICGLEVIHVEKGQKPQFHFIGYFQPVDQRDKKYQLITKSYWCPWFRRQRFVNLLNDDAPWNGFGDLLNSVPKEWLWNNNSYFSHDARQLFTQEGGFDMTTTTTTKTREYAEIVYKIAQSFVLGKLASKYDLQWKKCKDNPKLEREYNEKKEKVVNEAFLAIRSRTEKQAFIDYFVSTLYPHVREGEFADFAQKLFQDTDDIRSLTLLALSSQYPIKRQSEAD